MIYIFLLVFMPKSAYNGQKLTKLVSKNTIAKANKTMASVPVIIPE
jgi:hypothetical protein